jgi:hypothetical protein
LNNIFFYYIILMPGERQFSFKPRGQGVVRQNARISNIAQMIVQQQKSQNQRRRAFKSIMRSRTTSVDSNVYANDDFSYTWNQDNDIPTQETYETFYDNTFENNIELNVNEIDWDFNETNDWKWEPKDEGEVNWDINEDSDLGWQAYDSVIYAEEPAAEEPAAEEPAAEEPVAEEPAAEEPVAEEPVAEEPVAEEPVAEEPVAEEPVAEEPVAEEPVAEEPVAEEPVAEEPVAEEPVAEEPVAEEIQAKLTTFQILLNKRKNKQ